MADEMPAAGGAGGPVDFPASHLDVDMEPDHSAVPAPLGGDATVTMDRVSRNEVDLDFLAQAVATSAGMSGRTAFSFSSSMLDDDRRLSIADDVAIDDSPQGHPWQAPPRTYYRNDSGGFVAIGDDAFITDSDVEEVISEAIDTSAAAPTARLPPAAAAAAAAEEAVAADLVAAVEGDHDDHGTQDGEDVEADEDMEADGGDESDDDAPGAVAAAAAVPAAASAVHVVDEFHRAARAEVLAAAPVDPLIAAIRGGLDDETHVDFQHFAYPPVGTPANKDGVEASFVLTSKRRFARVLRSHGGWHARNFSTVDSFVDTLKRYTGHFRRTGGKGTDVIIFYHPTFGRGSADADGELRDERKIGDRANALRRAAAKRARAGR
uniref:Uncharacterized protein n=1 Tax=Bicosoecida sp. CB-2014 TaxID=1486930 RepID=A0A7S1CFT6_9STRA|mmetsp:Transcript_22632/g.79189  ORF Transcript_22632/g.79189 Transcript_22632/m.79189 type:complete len:379 (+) Transcript_22632:123-1259(+)